MTPDLLAGLALILLAATMLTIPRVDARRRGGRWVR